MDSRQIQSREMPGWLAIGQHKRIVFIVVGILIVAVILVLNYQNERTMCHLIQGYSLRNNDLQRIQVALSSAGLNDFKVTENNIEVPQNQRNTYLQAVSDAGALPDDISLKPQDQANLNPFLSRVQQEAIQLSEKKKQVREMVARLPFVEQAWFEMDRAKAKSAFQTDEQSAVVLVQPNDEIRLDAEQVATIRGLISGAIAGIDSQAIVVTDLNAGIAYQDNELIESAKLGADASKQVSFYREQSIHQKHQYENRIRTALVDFEGVDFTIEVVSIPANEISLSSEIAQDRKPTILSVGTNGQAAIPTMEKSHKPVVIPSVDEVVRVTVEIPEEVLVDAIPQEQRATLATFRNHSDYVSKLEALKTEIITRIRPILPISSFANPLDFPITFVVRHAQEMAANADQPTWSEQSLTRVGGPWGLATLCGIAFLIVVFVFSGSTKPERDASESGSDEPAMPSPNTTAAQASVGATTDESIKKEISKLIQEDPEAAAQVIKRWIRDAA